jgi:DNA-binding NtrC family response regulator
MRILIADDAEGVRQLLERILERAIPGCQAVGVSDAFEALQQFNRGSFDLLVTDYHMPGKNGLELAQAVRQFSPETRIILMSGNGIVKSGALNGATEVDGFLEKPFTLAQVLVMVDHVTQRMAEREA